MKIKRKDIIAHVPDDGLVALTKSIDRSTLTPRARIFLEDIDKGSPIAKIPFTSAQRHWLAAMVLETKED